MPQKKKKERITAARYTKGYRMLERYEGKLSRTVLRRGRASNRSFLFDDIYLWKSKNKLRNRGIYSKIGTLPCCFWYSTICK